MATINYWVAVKYARHPYLADGSINEQAEEVTQAYFTVDNQGKDLMPSEIRELALQQFLKSGMKYVSIGDIYIVSEEAY